MTQPQYGYPPQGQPQYQPDPYAVPNPGYGQPAPQGYAPNPYQQGPPPGYGQQMPPNPGYGVPQAPPVPQGAKEVSFAVHTTKCVGPTSPIVLPVTFG